MELFAVNKSDEHYNACKSWLEDKEITKWLTSILRIGRYYRIIHNMWIEAPRNKIFFIKINNQLVGTAGFINIDKLDRRAEIFYFIGSKSNINRGIASDAVSLLKEMAVIDYNLLTLYAKAAATNIASIRVLEKSGFQYIGKYRRAFNMGGEFIDHLIFDWVFEGS